ncbi:MAG: glycine--tRNA ligase subunit alpha [Acidobacteriota bacterium]
MTLQELILALEKYWAGHGCLIAQPYDLEVGAGTMSPDTFFRVLGPEPWRVAYVQPARRPADGRYGENPFRLFKHFQYQVILKPSPDDIQDVYLESLRAFGVDPREHDVRFEEDNWESPTLGAAGVGWQVLCDGMEITQFTYFQQCGGIELDCISAEITYGIERIGMFLNNVENVFDLPWAPGPPGSEQFIRYGEIRRQEELEQSRYCFDLADIEMNRKLFEMQESESRRLLEEGAVGPAYDACLKCSHTFNVLEARGALGVTERTGYIARVRRLASACALEFLASREKQGFPLARSRDA